MASFHLEFASEYDAAPDASFGVTTSLWAARIPATRIAALVQDVPPRTTHTSGGVQIERRAVTLPRDVA